MSSCLIPANPDASGIGIRIGVYVTSILVVLVPETSGPHHGVDKLRRSLQQAALLNAFALIVTACVQTIMGRLDLYHAIIVMHHTGFLSIALSSGGWRRDTALRLVLHYVTVWITGSAATVWMLYVWIAGVKFGVSNFRLSNPGFANTDDCNNSIKYVVMAINIRATVSWFRWLTITWASVVGLGLIFYPIMAFATYIARNPYTPSKSGSTPTYETVSTNSDFLNDLDTLGSNGPTESRIHATRSVSVKFTWENCLYAVIIAYGFAMSELTILRNHVQQGENVLSFGQVAAVTIASGGLKEMLYFCIGREWRYASEQDEKIMSFKDVIAFYTQNKARRRLRV